MICKPAPVSSDTACLLSILVGVAAESKNENKHATAVMIACAGFGRSA